MFRYQSITLGMLFVITSGLCAQTSVGRYPITPAQVSTALAASNIVVLPKQVALPLPLTAAVPDPALIIAGVTPVRDRELNVRVMCARRIDCLPFLASLVFPDHNAVDAVAHQWHSQSQLQVPQRSLESVAAIRAGATATMMIDQDKIHVLLPVVCLESGVVGQRIRVAASHDRSRTFTADVIDARSLRGIL